MNEDKRVLDPGPLLRALTLRDLSDVGQGPHAMQTLLDEVVEALRRRWGCAVVVHRASPVTTVADNYDRLRYPSTGVARAARYTRYLDARTLLRTHTSAMVPAALRILAGARVEDTLLACPGLVYRRDCIDRLHTGEPHQLDLWRLWSGASATDQDLDEMIDAVVRAALPEAEGWRTLAASHPYTRGGRQIDARVGSRWIEVGECGRAEPAVLSGAGLPGEVTGLAMGLGLDRLLMIRKGIDDIRLLRSEDPRVAGQMLDLETYRPVSAHPPALRDLSLAIEASVDADLIGDRVRDVLGEDAVAVETLDVLSQTARCDLPAAAVARMGLKPGQKNVLLRLVIRHPERTLSGAEANAIRDRVYLALHEGSRTELTQSSGAARRQK